MNESIPQRQSALRPALMGAGAALCVFMALGAAPRSSIKVPNLPNASAQRLAIIEAIQNLDKRVEKFEETLTSGDVVVKVSEIPEVNIAE